MSVASGKKNLRAWRRWLSYRHYGALGPGAFSVREKLLFGASSLAARGYLRVVRDTCRWTLHGDADWRHDVLMGRQAFIFVPWHNRVSAFFVYLAQLAARDPGFRCASIISPSKDGELLARPIRESDGLVIRGSSSRKAAGALREAVDVARRGGNIATVGDGPKGPRYRLKPGPVMLAKASGLPIVPVSWSCTRVMQTHRSWDQMMLPLPFSNIEMRFGRPIHVPADAGPRDIAAYRRKIEGALMDMTRLADARTRVQWQVPRAKEGETLKRRDSIELAGRHYRD